MRIQLSTHPGVILLGAWLVASGLAAIFGQPSPALVTVLALVAVAAGVLLVLEVRGIAFSSNLATLLLGVWLLATALLALFPELGFPHDGEVVPAIGVAAGAAMILQVRTFTLLLLLLVAAVALAALVILT